MFIWRGTVHVHGMSDDTDYEAEYTVQARTIVGAVDQTITAAWNDTTRMPKSPLSMEVTSVEVISLAKVEATTDELGGDR